MGATPKCQFFWDSQVGSPKILKIGTPTTLDAYNFLCKRMIELRSKKKLYSLSRDFQQYVAPLLHTCNSKQFLTFNGRESN
jgi:hypothetical protein